MANLKLKYDKSSITDDTLFEYAEKIKEIHNNLNEKANNEGEFLGWLELPTNYDKSMGLDILNKPKLYLSIDEYDEEAKEFEEIQGIFNPNTLKK